MAAAAGAAAGLALPLTGGWAWPTSGLRAGSQTEGDMVLAFGRAWDRGKRGSRAC